MASVSDRTEQYRAAVTCEQAGAAEPLDDRIIERTYPLERNLAPAASAWPSSLWGSPSKMLGAA
jgi:hypothetical protein